MSRQSSYTEETADQLCDLLADGIPLRVICRGENMPAWRTVYDWMAADTAFAARIARAREAGFDALASQCLEIADDETEDWLLTKKGPILNEAAVARSKLRVDTRLKLLAKWDPKRYGEKMQLSGDAEAPLTVEIVRFGNNSAS